MGKKTAILAVIALVACKPSVSRPDPTVSRVLAARWEARATSVSGTYQRVEHGPGWAGYVTHKQFDPRQYCRKIQQIDAADCPKEFQLAWMDYQHAWRAEMDDTDGLIFLVEIGATLYTGGTAAPAIAGGLHAAQSQKEKREALNESWFRLQKAAVMFNCPSPTNYVD